MASAAERTRVLPFPSSARRETPTRLPFDLPGEVVPLPAAPPVKPPVKGEVVIPDRATVLAELFDVVHDALGAIPPEARHQFTRDVRRLIGSAQAIAISST